MNYYNNYGKGQSIKNFFLSKTTLSNLIVINIAVWLIVAAVNLFLYLFNSSSPVEGAKISNDFIYWLAVPADFTTLLHRPWTLFTYMFLHERFFHLLFNVITLYFAGRLFLMYLNNKQLLTTYLVGGILGAVAFILAYNIFPVFENQISSAVALGASASALAVLTSVAAYAPNMELNLFIKWKVKLKYIAIAFIILDLMMISQGNAGGHIAHLGGALWGFIYGLCLKNKNAFTLNKLKQLFNARKQKIQNRKYKKQQERIFIEKQEQKVKEQKRIDEILSKISRSGYDSLNAEEKELLFSKSKK